MNIRQEAVPNRDKYGPRIEPSPWEKGKVTVQLGMSPLGHPFMARELSPDEAEMWGRMLLEAAQVARNT